MSVGQIFRDLKSEVVSLLNNAKNECDDIITEESQWREDDAPDRCFLLEVYDVIDRIAEPGPYRSVQQDAWELKHQIQGMI